jgi:Kdo2-lipid IVA lauroyltransferase/acyltransferase
MYRILFALLWLITLLPLRVLYLISDLLYPIIYYITGYRKMVVRENIEKSFPDKTEKERLKIEKQFYRFFCDLFIETLKQLHFSQAEMSRRITFGNVDLVLEQYNRGKSIMLMTAHYANWEWISSMSMYLPADKALHPIYKRLTSKDSDLLMNKLRSKYGGTNIEKSSLLRTMVRMKSKEQIGAFGMVSDQTPPRNFQFSLEFLNQKTPMLTGSEELAKKFDYPVFYAKLTRIRRGYYHCDLIPISMEPKETAEHEITEKYMGELEKQILEAPHLWLWTHKRWKYVR